MLLLDHDTRRIFSTYLSGRRALLKGRPEGIDPNVWFGWLHGTRAGVEIAEVVILARAFGPGVYAAFGREDLAETKKLRLYQ